MSQAAAPFVSLYRGALWALRVIFGAFRPLGMLWLGLLACVMALSIFHGAAYLHLTLQLRPVLVGLDQGTLTLMDRLLLLQMLRQLESQAEMLAGAALLGVALFWLWTLPMALAGCLAHFCCMDYLVWGGRSPLRLLGRYLLPAIGMTLPALAALGGCWLLGAALLAGAGVAMDGAGAMDSTTAAYPWLAGLAALVILFRLTIFFLSHFALPLAAMHRTDPFRAVGFGLGLLLTRPLACAGYLALHALLNAGLLIALVLVGLVWQAVWSPLHEQLDPPWLLQPETLTGPLTLALLAWLTGLLLLQPLLLPLTIWLRTWNLTFLSYVSPRFAGINPLDREDAPPQPALPVAPRAAPPRPPAPAQPQAIKLPPTPAQPPVIVSPPTPTQPPVIESPPPPRQPLPPLPPQPPSVGPLPPW